MKRILRAVIPGAGAAIKNFRQSKFSKYSGMPKIAAKRGSGYHSSMFKSYWNEMTRCAITGHIALPATRKDHFPTCSVCTQILWGEGYRKGQGWTPEIEKAYHGDLREYCGVCDGSLRNGKCWRCAVRAMSGFPTFKRRSK